MRDKYEQKEELKNIEVFYIDKPGLYASEKYQGKRIKIGKKTYFLKKEMYRFSEKQIEYCSDTQLWAIFLQDIGYSTVAEVQYGNIISEWNHQIYRKLIIRKTKGC